MHVSPDSRSAPFKDSVPARRRRMALPFHFPGGTLLLVKRYAIKTKNIYLMGPRRRQTALEARSRWQRRSRGQRAHWGVGPKANATTNQFRPRRKVCSHCRECGDATSVQIALHAQTEAQREAVSPRALVPIRWWHEAPLALLLRRVRRSCRHGTVRATSREMKAASAVLAVARQDPDQGAVYPDRGSGRRVLS